MAWFSLVSGIVAGFACAWSSATQWEILLPFQRVPSLLLFLGVSVMLSLLWSVVERRVWPLSDWGRALGFLLGAALCFSIVRQEITLLVYNALWAVSGTFLGSAVAKALWLGRVEAPSEARASHKAEEESLCLS